MMDLGEENEDRKADQPDGGNEDNDDEAKTSKPTNNRKSHRTDSSRKGKNSQGTLPHTSREKSRSRSRSKTRKTSISSLSKSWKSANAWLNFMQDFRANLRGIRGMRNPSIFRLASERWSEMTPEEKKPYIDAANRVKRQKHLENYNKERNSKEGTRRKRPRTKKSAVVPRKTNQKNNYEQDAETDRSDSEYDSGQENSGKNLDSDNTSVDSD